MDIKKILGRVTKVSPDGSIEVDTESSGTITSWPKSRNIVSVPLTDELVILSKVPSKNHTGVSSAYQWVYEQINIQNEPSTSKNPAVTGVTTTSGISYASETGFINNVSLSGPTIDSTPLSTGLRFAPGDVLLESRKNNLIRLDSDGNINLVAGKSSEDETLQLDDTSIYLTTSGERVNGIGLVGRGPQVINTLTYTNPQLVAKSSRVIFLADDELVLKSNSDVLINSNDWRTSINELMGMVEALTNLVLKLSSPGTITVATPTGPATSTLVTTLAGATQLKASVLSNKNF